VKRTLLVVLLAVTAVSAAASRPFTFAVLGDRTGSTRPEVFKQILAEIVLFRPDFIICTGDLIEGYAGTEQTNAEWDTVLGQLRATGIPYYVAPGNHDISSDAAEPIFVKRVGQPLHTLKRGNSVFIFLDNSRWSKAQVLPPTELKWLDRELTRAKESRHVFVVMHLPYWRDALDKGLPEPLQTKFKSAGVGYVFTGHDHFYCSHTWDGINYFQVGPSGSRFEGYREPGAGAFQNYLLCRVSGDSVAITVREPGHIEPMPADTVTYESIRALELTRARAITLDTVAVPDSGAVAASPRVVIRNLTDRELASRLSWHEDQTSWRLDPAEVTYSMAPHGQVTQSFTVGLDNPDSLYPLPGLTTAYEYAPGKKTTLAVRIPIRREAEVVRASRRPFIDGQLNDDCWTAEPTLRGFGSRTGRRSPLEPTAVWIARDDSMLYIAARCSDSLAAGLEAKAIVRDGKVQDDDNLSIILDFGRRAVRTGRLSSSIPGAADSGVRAQAGTAPCDTCYQVLVNVVGTIADRKCWVNADKPEKDIAWTGNWRVATARGADSWTIELSCPLSDFGPVDEEWKVNASRYQSRTNEVAVWQAPFENEPGSLGALHASK
jgi:Icc protein